MSLTHASSPSNALTALSAQRACIETRRATVAVVGLGYVGLPVRAGADCVVILTPHPDVDYTAVVEASSLVFDATGVTRPLRADSVVRL